MVEAELLIGHLRQQVRNMQSLLNYLESCDQVHGEDYTYSHSRLRELIGGLKALEKFSLERGTIHNLRAVWMN